MTRTPLLSALLIATTITGVSLPYMIAGEVAGSWPTLVVGVLVGLACLRLALHARGRGGRILGVIGTAAAALAPVVAYLAQESSERELVAEAAHSEPSLAAAIAIQAPLVILGLLILRLLIGAFTRAMRVWSRRAALSPARRPTAVQTPSLGAPLQAAVALARSNGERAPPVPASHRLALQG
ncbi:MAG: hypothetical protein QFC55_03140 [Chloroflexota bacterium]|nr:hypothetical protein [Chloroflexota bacterium]